MDSKNKRILITAGPTWVAIDNVRVISNAATGKTGCLLADELSKRGAKVTLLLGPSEEEVSSKKVKVIRFKFFEELKNVLLKELRSKKYHALIHSAAVSDYKPAKMNKGKIKSGKSALNIKLIPTEKLIDSIKKTDKDIKLVGFKYELGLTEKQLIAKATDLIKRSGSELVVANTQDRAGYKAFLVEKNIVSDKIFNKQALINKLINKL